MFVLLVPPYCCYRVIPSLIILLKIGKKKFDIFDQKLYIKLEGTNCYPGANRFGSCAMTAGKLLMFGFILWHKNASTANPTTPGRREAEQLALKYGLV